MASKINLVSAWVTSVMCTAMLANAATAQDVEMSAHYTDAPERKVVLPPNTEDLKIKMPVDADLFANGKTVASIAQLDTEFADYMIIPTAEQLSKTNPKILRQAEHYKKRFERPFRELMQNLPQNEQDRIIHVFAVLITIDALKKPEQQKYTSDKVLKAYQIDAERQEGAFMHATNLVINHRNSTDENHVNAIQKHGLTHFTLKYQQQYIDLLKAVETESNRILKTGPHLEAN